MPDQTRINEENHTPKDDGEPTQANSWSVFFSKLTHSKVLEYMPLKLGLLWTFSLSMQMLYISLQDQLNGRNNAGTAYGPTLDQIPYSIALFVLGGFYFCLDQLSEEAKQEETFFDNIAEALKALIPPTLENVGESDRLKATKISIINPYKDGMLTVKITGDSEVSDKLYSALQPMHLV